MFNQLPETLRLTGGAVRLPEIVMLLNDVTAFPLIVVVPLNVTSPLRGVNVPLLIQFPAIVIGKLLVVTSSVDAESMLRSLLTIMLPLNDFTLPPVEILKYVAEGTSWVLLPLKTTVPVPLVKVERDGVSVRDLATFRVPPLVISRNPLLPLPVTSPTITSRQAVS